jgi:hypothetical protein
MTFYRTSPRKSTSASFARQAAIEAFGPKAVHHLIGPDFADRKPGDDLKDADEIVEGREAIAGWLALAMSSEGEEAEVAYQTADELRRTLRLEWGDLIGRAAA